MALRRPFVELGWQHKELGNGCCRILSASPGRPSRSWHHGLGTTEPVMTTAKKVRKLRYRPILKLPALPHEQFLALRDNIAVHGVLVPILVDEDKRIIDGNYRKNIADELGYDCPELMQEGLGDDEKRTLARAL